MSRADIGAGAVCVALAVFVFYETAGYPDSPVSGAPGPAFFPRALAGVLLVLSATLITRAIRSGAEPAAGPVLVWSRLGRSGGTLALIALFLLVVERGDFLVLLACLLAAVMAIMGERRIVTLVLVPALFVAFVYIVFSQLFGVPFPTRF